MTRKIRGWLTSLTLVLSIITYNLTTAPAICQAGPPAQTDNAALAAYQHDVKALQAIDDQHDLDALAAFAAQKYDTWSRTGGEYFYRFMGQVCDALDGEWRGVCAMERQEGLAQKYALLCLGTIETNWNTPCMEADEEQLVLQTWRKDDDDYRRGRLNPAAWKDIRDRRVTLWFHAWRRIEAGIDPKFDFSKGYLAQVPPPSGAHIFAGEDPKDIRDPKLRAEYEARIAANSRRADEYLRQMELRDLRDSYLPVLEHFLVTVYSHPPRDPGLEALLRTNIRDEQVRRNVLDDLKASFNDQDSKSVSALVFRDMDPASAGQESATSGEPLCHRFRPLVTSELRSLSRLAGEPLTCSPATYFGTSVLSGTNDLAAFTFSTMRGVKT